MPRKYRQGQTIYYISKAFPISLRPHRPELEAIFLYSDKQATFPHEGEKIVRFSPHMVDRKERTGVTRFFKKKSQAKSHLHKAMCAYIEEIYSLRDKALKQIREESCQDLTHYIN